MRISLRQFTRVHRARIILISVVLALATFASIFANPYQPVTVHEAHTDNSLGHEPVYMRARVLNVNSNKSLKVQLLDGPKTGVIRDAKEPVESDKIQQGDIILINESDFTGISAVAPWRVPGLISLAALLIIVVIVVSGFRGLYSLIGLTFGIAVIIIYTIPAILAGANAFLACVLTAFIIGTISVYVSHGMSKRSAISTASMGVVLLMTTLLAALGSEISSLTGVADEASAYLATEYGRIDIAGVLAGGIVIATLGVLDDVVTTQVAAADEIKKANPELSAFSLFQRTMSVGNEHIAALINTLALAYIGVSLPTILLILAVPTTEPAISLINSEFLAHEIARALVSSIALVLAVPISSLIAVILLEYQMNARALLRILRRRADK